MTIALGDRVALITGASSGIGEAVALALAAAGVRVALTARRADRLQTLAQKIEATGGTSLLLPGDITDEAFATDAVDKAAAHFGRFDILVNSAGIMPEGGVENADLAQWRRVIEVNLLASLYTCRAAVGVMRSQGMGDIINISSTSGRRATGLFGSYSTSKFGLTAMTEGLRQEVGGQGIRVCTIEPGATNTALWENITDLDLRHSVQLRAQRDGVMLPEDIAASVLFVVSLPPRANVSELLIRPTSDTGPM